MDAGALQRVDQSQISPRERIDTMPTGVPEFTLGWGAIQWITDNLKQPNGKDAGKPFRVTRRQAMFLLWFYAVDASGDWRHIRGVRRLAKGSGKSPFAAVLALLELLGPVRVDHFDPDVPGGVVGKPVGMPLVQIAATSERQTANTMRMVKALSNRRTNLARKYQLDTGKTFVETPEGGRLEQIASSTGSAEGAEVSFVVADETEHWTPGAGGPSLMSVITRNAAKTGSRVVETSNAWVPGNGSVAESTFEAWAEQQEGKSRATRTILYDAVVAPPNTALTDDPEPGQISLTAGLEYVYGDCAWVNIEDIKQNIWQANAKVSESRMFYLNQPSAADSSWVNARDWTVLADHDRKLVDGEEIVMFFDGSKSNDNSALVACCLSDGFIATLGVWEPDKDTGVIDANAVDSAVRRARDRFEVVAFWADVKEFESYVHTAWPELFADDKLIYAVPSGREQHMIAWDMRSHTSQFAEACERTFSEIQEGAFHHDGDWHLSNHVANCRVYEYKGREYVKKESPKSAKKIDAAICMIGARMMYRYVIDSDEYRKRKKRGQGWRLL